jgi:VanZ family protein
MSGRAGAAVEQAAGRRQRFWLALLIAWVGLTFVLTSLPGAHLPAGVAHFDKAAHAAFYGVMGLLCGMWRRESGVPAGRAFLQALLFTAAVGAVDEIHQVWIPGRSAEFLDWVADVAGGGAGGALASLFPVPLTAPATE